MVNNNESTEVKIIDQLSTQVTKAAGTTGAFLIAFSVIVIWLICGPFLNFSPNWQMFINTCTTIITFLMVFLIQKAQNKDSLAIQLKLNELVAANASASNRLVNVENMTEDELKVIQKYYSKLSDFAQKEEKMQISHSIDENHEQHNFKKEMEKELSEQGKKKD